MTSIDFPANVSAEKQEFVRSFYATSDDPQAVDKYLSFLTRDVDFVMGPSAIKGEAAVRKLRENMWGGVKTRRHTPARVYTATSAEQGESTELMIHGTVDYGLASGKRVDNVGWAALMVFAPGQKLELSRYQVWIDMSLLQTALKEESSEKAAVLSNLE